LPPLPASSFHLSTPSSPSYMSSHVCLCTFACTFLQVPAPVGNILCLCQSRWISILYVPSSNYAVLGFLIIFSFYQLFSNLKAGMIDVFHFFLSLVSNLGSER
jgi:hypothetical protein